MNSVTATEVAGTLGRNIRMAEGHMTNLNIGEEQKLDLILEICSCQHDPSTER